MRMLDLDSTASFRCAAAPHSDRHPAAAAVNMAPGNIGSMSARRLLK